MQITDTIADLLTRIRNANSAKHETVDIPASNMKKAIVQILLDEGYITNVAVLPEVRRLHVADALMDKLEEVSAAKGLSFITLEVRESNFPAISLYRKHGYETAGVRKNYYQSPSENALIMTKTLCEELN